MSSPEKKKRKTTTTTPNPPVLPDDLLVSIFARISRLYYPTLSLVSKSFRWLLSSPELYETRSLLGRSESCLYVCLQNYPSESNHRWFTLARKPNQTLSNTNSEKKKKKKKEPSGYVLARIPVLESPVSVFSSLASVGSNIYNIGGYPASSSVWILDCWSHTWQYGPSLRGKRKSPSASVVDGKLYVAGGCRDEDSDTYDSIEVLDPSSQIWDLVHACPQACKGLNWNCKPTSACTIEGKLHLLFGDKGVTYEPKEGKWGTFQQELCDPWIWWSPHCAIEDVLYRYESDDGAVKWYNTKDTLWRNVKGLDGLPEIACYATVILADHGGKMAVLWDERELLPSSECKNNMIWCAVISLERRSSGEEVCGKVEWCDEVLSVPKEYDLERALSATV
ncbi:hypothetical protein EUTSA_v10028720mg [Eutrema salsugineum]|uniref:F-box domain-containing protein n=1 Tax=Eutrema salsugineum TaxID=72664 RepID=V4MZZ2_EUTSA|nr:F-box/kelch-repeat protein At4g39550 [Eutrema salsugineum]ESQ38271.1 hypothetical protein EUTSA_v10028720mg [Eutrema salsugineum]